MARVRKIAARTNPALERSLTWSGLRPGDAVVVDAPKERRSEFVFVAHVRNDMTGDEWVEVRGGRSGEAKDRSFQPGVIYSLAARRGSRVVGLSLADAPRLPLC